MFDERALIAQFESAETDEMIRILDRPSEDAENLLRAHLGNCLYQKMHDLALRCRIQRERQRPIGNVVVIPAFLGSELKVRIEGQPDERLWLNVPRIMDGCFQRLRLAEDGLRAIQEEDNIHAGGLVKRAYGELILSLARRWNVKAFKYDWRKDIEESAANLLARINHWFGVTAPVHIVAHGMGGLIARAFLRDQRARWTTMESKTSPAAGGRLLMLGTANHGSYTALRALTGLSDFVTGLTAIDRKHDVTDILKVVHSFVSLYQLLPSPVIDKALDKLYDAKSYGELRVLRDHLRRARETQERLNDAIDIGRMTQIVGYGYRTPVGITDIDSITQESGYRFSMKGDGNVAVDLALLRHLDGRRADIPTYFLHEDHSGLACSPRLLAMIDKLLESGTSPELRTALPEDIDREPNATENSNAQTLPAADSRISNQTKSAADHLHTRGSASLLSRITHEERILSDGLVRGLTVPADMTPKQGDRPRPKPGRIELGLEWGELDTIEYDDLRSAKGQRVDVIAVGHYIGVMPQGQELAIDKAISRAHLLKQGIDKQNLDRSDLLLTQYSERGIIRGELGQPFFLDDPRTANPGERLIAVVGMGLPGRFGVPELSVLVRELVWSVGRLGKRHLAAAHIGTKNANLSVGDSIAGWVKGIKAALTGVYDPERQCLSKVTFLTKDHQSISKYQDAILGQKRKMDSLDRLTIEFTARTTGQLEEIKTKALQRERETAANLPIEIDFSSATGLPTPTQVTLGLDREMFRYGAITENAAISERTVPVDRILVEEANKELAKEWEHNKQLERGRFLGQLIIPRDLREMMASDAPLVMMLDSAAARIHWEMVATPDPVRSINNSQADKASQNSSPALEFDSYFLGTSRGFTRQLRTTFAPPPDPPPPPSRILRVLVVADPAEDARLPGAEAEGVEIGDLFETFNTVDSRSNGNQVEVVRLIGPRQATRTNVLRELMIRSYDVLHFAGHCVFDEKHPSESGWVFAKNERISAKELTRIDRVPGFIFSNACESGVTPDRSDRRSVALAPTFAESFFERGVSNFVCTAWPVYDVAAREFALELYAHLLGLKRLDGQPDRYERIEPTSMVRAMQRARLAIAPLEGGIRMWGAYQHYGNPYFRFFAPSKLSDNAPASHAPIVQLSKASDTPPASQIPVVLESKASGNPPTSPIPTVPISNGKPPNTAHRRNSASRKKRTDQ